MTTTALINPMSGGVGPDGADRMAEALERAGVPSANVIALEPGDIDRQIKDHIAAAPDMLIVWGGDGTLRSALTCAGPSFPGLVLLPGGTMNLLLRWIHGERPWSEILSAVVASPRPRSIPAGRIDGHMFYCAMLAGAPVVLAEARESLRRGDIVSSVMKSGEAIEQLQSTHLHARFSNGFGFADGALPTSSVIGAMVGPLCPNGDMEVAALADASAASALDVIWNSLVADWRNSPSVRIAPAHSLIIDRDDGEPIPLILDGEPVDIDDSIHVTYVEDAATCLVAG